MSVDRQGRLEVQRHGWEVRVGGGTAELVHGGDCLQAVLGAQGQSKVKDGRQGCR